MPPDGADVTYSSTNERCGEPGAVDVHDRSGQLLLSVSVEFLQLGHVATYAYLKEQCLSCFEEVGTLVREEDGSALADDDAVSIGRLIYDIGSTRACTPRVGPRFRNKYRPASDDTMSSTMSNSSRSSVMQSHFGLGVAVRDGSCLLTETWYSGCVAAHILPQSRPEYYEEFLGRKVASLDAPRFGVLLRHDLHHAFDRRHFAFYPQGDNLIVHFFHPDPWEYSQYHGKVISPGRFRGHIMDRPDRQLLLFHYRQCAMMHLRCYSWGMRPPAT
ncbi:unnamed protein product [Parajaminaea phylloscopi]